MSTQRFLKLVDSQESDWLFENHPKAFLLLTLIAKRARRISGHIDGLEPGECHIGDHESCGLTRQEYRTALKILVENRLIEIKETCRSRKKHQPPINHRPNQKSTTGSTTVGTKVKLIDSRIYDLNIEESNHRINHRSTTDQTKINHEQENKNVKKEQQQQQAEVDPVEGNVVVFPSEFVLEQQDDRDAIRIEQLLKQYGVNEEMAREYSILPFSQVKDATAALEQAESKGQVTNRIGFLRNAIENKWKPNETKETTNNKQVEEIEKNKQECIKLESEFQSFFSFDCNFKIQSDRVEVKSRGGFSSLPFSESTCVSSLKKFIGYELKQNIKGVM